MFQQQKKSHVRKRKLHKFPTIFSDLLQGPARREVDKQNVLARKLRITETCFENDSSYRI